MTGAPLPAGRGRGGDAGAHARRPGAGLGRWRSWRRWRPGSTCGRAGEDARAGRGAAAGGHAAGHPGAGRCSWAQGLAPVPVPRRPRVAILSTGDELCRADEPPEGRIVDTNAPCAGAGGPARGRRAHAAGHRAGTRARRSSEALGARSTASTWCSPARASPWASTTTCARRSSAGRGAWTSGGWPSSPASRWRWAGAARTLFFGLPGNPTSSLVTFELFVRPALRRLLGHSDVEPCPGVRPPGRRACRKAAGLAHFVRVTAAWRDGRAVGPAPGHPDLGCSALGGRGHPPAALSPGGQQPGSWRPVSNCLPLSWAA